MSLFSFSSAPSFLDGDPVTTAEISPILAERFSVLKHISLRINSNPFCRCWPQMRDFVPGWTAIVSIEIHNASRALRPPINVAAFDTRLSVRVSSV